MTYRIKSFCTWACRKTHKLPPPSVANFYLVFFLIHPSFFSIPRAHQPIFSKCMTFHLFHMLQCSFPWSSYAWFVYSFSPQIKCHYQKKKNTFLTTQLKNTYKNIRVVWLLLRYIHTFQEDNRNLRWLSNYKSDFWKREGHFCILPLIVGP